MHLYKYTLLLTFISCFTSLSVAQSLEFEQLNSSSFYGARNGSISVADIDNDGDLDMVLAGVDGNVRRTTIYTNNGQAEFTEQENSGLSTSTEFGFSTFEDVDNDGDQDLLTTGRDNNSNPFSNLYLNDGLGNFTLINSGLIPCFEGGIAFADFDNDTDPDLLLSGVGAQGEPVTKLYLNDGNGAFAEMNTPNIEAMSSSRVSFFDMDGDGDQDFLFTGTDVERNPQVFIYENDGMANFSAVQNLALEAVSFSSIATGDSDGDGDIDIILNGSHPSLGSINQLYLNDSNGSFTAFTEMPFIASILGAVEFVDFDKDDDLDVLVTGSIGGSNFTASIYENMGDNQFVEADNLIGAYLTTVAVGDLDGDEDLDLIINGISSVSFSPFVYLNKLETSSIYNAQFSQFAKLYPNPSKAFFELSIESTKPSKLQIFSSQGNLVYQSNIQGAHQTIQHNLPAGVYTAVLQSGARIQQEKLVIYY